LKSTFISLGSDFQGTNWTPNRKGKLSVFHENRCNLFSLEEVELTIFVIAAYLKEKQIIYVIDVG